MLEIGNRVGPYEIRERIGEGGMAIVYKVWHVGLHRLEALKVPRHMHDYGPNPDFVQRLLAEARLAASLHHPHIVTIHNVSEADAPVQFFAMDLVDGQDLALLLERRQRLPLDEVVAILGPVAEALDYAHSRGIVHRDVKPGNILLQETKGASDWIVKVVDFGISRAAEDTEGTRLTKSGMIVGTAEYMSPEQAGSGYPVDFRTDIYSLGIVAYEMLTGAPPFRATEGASRMSILMNHVHHLPPPLTDLDPPLPTAANNGVLKALAKNPDERFSTCSSFIEALSGARFVRPPVEPGLVVAPSPSNPVRTGATPLPTPVPVGTMVEPPARAKLFADRAPVDLVPVTPGPPPTPALAPDSAPLPTTTPASPSVPPVSPAPSAPVSTRKPPSRILPLVLGVGVIGAAGIGLVSMFRGGSQPTNSSANSVTATAAPATAAATSAPAATPNPTTTAVPRAVTPTPAAAPRKVTKIARTQTIPFPKQVQKTAALKIGQQRVKRPGQLGQRQVTVEIVTRGAQEISRRILSNKVLKPPVPQLALVGTAPLIVPRRVVPHHVRVYRPEPRRVRRPVAVHHAGRRVHEAPLPP